MELPRLEPLYQTYRDQGFGVIAVEAMRDTERAQKFIAEKGLTYPMLENGEDEAEFIRKQYQIGLYPTSFLIDGDGRVLFIHIGFDEGDEVKLAKEIEKVLAL